MSKRILINLGDSYGLLTVLQELESEMIGNRKRRFLLCKCECGVVKKMLAENVLSGHSKSCGCERERKAKLSRLKHGLTNKVPEYYIWQSMKYRCYNKKNPKYKNYGGRGIIVCDRWINSFENFYSDMGSRITNRHSLDRIDVNGNYEPSNCRWASMHEQAINKTNNVIIEYMGIKMCQSHWAAKLNTRQERIHELLKYKKTGEEVIDFIIKKDGIILDNILN